MIKKVVLLFFLLLKITYPVTNYENFEDSFIQIKCGDLQDNFFMVKYDIETNKVYIGLNSLFYFLELYTLEVRLKEMKVIGVLGNKNINIKFNSDEAFIMENSLYVDLEAIKEKLNFRKITFNYENLSISMIPNFTLPYEMREKSKIERLRLDAQNGGEDELDIVMPAKLLTPGFLKVNWYKYDLQEKSYNLEYEYGTQFLYGNLYLNGDIEPKYRINYGNLTYSNIWENNDLVLGSFSMVSPNFINIGSDIIGISFRDENTYMTRDGGVTIIKGEAENAQVIELYREYTLIDYIYPTSKNFEFKIVDGVLNSDYILKIYYNDGRIEEKRVFSLTDMDILQKGKNRTSLQLGKNSNNGNPQGIFHTYYGVTDNLTLGLGVMELTSFENRKYNFLQNDILFNTRHKEYPTLVTYRNFYENNQSENSYNLIIEQKLKSYTLRYLHESYSPLIYEENRLKDYTSMTIGKNFEKNSIEIGVNNKRLFEKSGEYKSDNLYLGWYTSIFSPLSFSLKMEKDLYRGYNYNVFYPSISYSGILSLIIDGEIGKERAEEKYTQNYSIRLNKRDIKIIEDKLYLDIGIFARYSSISERFRYGITFDIEWDNYIHMGVTSTTNISENKERTTTNSIETSKLVNLSSPISKVDNTASVSSAWLYGRVYFDKNGNHIFDSGDTPLSGVEVLIDNKGFLTDKNGNYIADSIAGDKIFTVDLNRKTLDPSYKNSDGKIKVKSRESATLKLDIPVQPISILSGNIILTDEFTEKQFIQNLSLITIFLEKDGEIVAETDPEFDGMYFFEDILPGKYTIRFNYLGYENVKFSRDSIEVNINNSENGEYFEGLDTDMIKGKEEMK